MNYYNIIISLNCLAHTRETRARACHLALAGVAGGGGAASLGKFNKV